MNKTSPPTPKYNAYKMKESWKLTKDKKKVWFKKWKSDNQIEKCWRMENLCFLWWEIFQNWRSLKSAKRTNLMEKWCWIIHQNWKILKISKETLRSVIVYGGIFILGKIQLVFPYKNKEIKQKRSGYISCRMFYFSGTGNNLDFQNILFVRVPL